MDRLNQVSTCIRQMAPLPTRCVWMDAGVINYKLCDRLYDCDRCPLDQALQRRPSVQSADLIIPDSERIFRSGR